MDKKNCAKNNRRDWKRNNTSIDSIKETLSNQGCPDKLNDNWFAHGCDCNVNDCVGCWEQNPYQETER
jgi:hypothetical protein